MTALLILPLLAASAAAEDAKIISLASASVPLGAAPDGCRPGKTGAAGGAVKWVVRKGADGVSGGVIAEVSQEKTDPKYPLCIFDSLQGVAVDVSVDITPLQGELDRAGGIVVRLVDPQNYYLVRANALEQNVRLYHVVNGVRTQFAGVEAHVFSDMTQRLRLIAQGEKFTVEFAGKKLFSATDGHFKQSGAVALWTKADSLTEFSNLTFAVLK